MIFWKSSILSPEWLRLRSITDISEFCHYRQYPAPMNRNILSDQIIRFSGPNSREVCPHNPHRVVFWDPKEEREIDLLTNHLDFGATTISVIYKDRWRIDSSTRPSSGT